MFPLFIPYERKRKKMQWGLTWDWKKVGKLGSFLWFSYRLSPKSVLLPTKTMMTSLPRSARTSSTHFAVFTNEERSKKTQSQAQHQPEITWWGLKFLVMMDRQRRGTGCTCNIIDHHSHRGVTNVRWNQGPKPKIVNRSLSILSPKSVP